MKQIAITGGSGKLGSYVLDRLKNHYELVNIDIQPSASHQDVAYRRVDLTDLEETIAVLADVDLVVHLAAIPNPTVAPLDVVMKVNTVSTYNVLEAVKQAGIKHVVYGSSDSVTGFGIHKMIPTPAYLPIDADHPCYPHESYSLSKYFGEQMCRQYRLLCGIEVVMLRFMGIWFKDLYPSLRKHFGNGSRTTAESWLGSYVVAQDAAEAVALSVAYLLGGDCRGCETFAVHAAQTNLDVDTLVQAEQIWGTVPPVKDPELYRKHPRAPFHDIATARERLGYQPAYDWKIILNHAMA